MSDDWMKATLGEVAEIRGGGTPSTKEPSYWSGDVVWLTPTEVVKSDGQWIDTSERTITYKGLENSSAKLLPAGAVLLTTRASVGYAALARVPLATNQGFQSLIPGEALLPEFLMYWIQSNRIEFTSRAGGSTFPEISKKKVAGIPIVVPPLAVQRRIVDLMAHLDTHITKLHVEHESLTRALSSVTNKLLIGLLDEPTSSLDELVETGVIQLGRGKVISKKDIESNPGSYPVYSSAKGNNGAIGAYGEFMFDEELITWSVDGGGHLFYRPQHRFSVTNIGGYLRILDQKVLSYRYLSLVLQDLHAAQVFDWQSKAHPSVIRRLYSAIPLPSLETQTEIADTVFEFYSLLKAIGTEIRTAQTSRAAVLTRLLEGSIEIPESYDPFLCEVA